MGGRRKQKLNIPMCLGCVLLFLTLLSIHLTSGLYARFSSSGTGYDEARVITFGDLTLQESGDFLADGKSMMIIPAVDIRKQATVTFDGSESATYVFVKVTLSDHWKQATPSNFAIPGITDDYSCLSWAVDDSWTYLDGSNYVFYQQLDPNETLNANIIDENTISVSPSISKIEIESLTDISISFQASAVQSIGFNTAADAWASLQAKEGAA